MNRALLVPAGCSLIAFAALSLRGALALPLALPEVDRAAQRAMPTAAPQVESQRVDRLLSLHEAEQALALLGNEYLRPWRQWESSPSRLFSRAAPRPIPTISTQIVMAPAATGEAGGMLLATIVVRKGSESESIPCVVDRITKRIRLYAGEQWLTEAEWLKSAPLP